MDLTCMGPYVKSKGAFWVALPIARNLIAPSLG